MNFDDYFSEYCEGLSLEARSLMRMSWNACKSRGDKHFFVDELAAACGYEPGHGKSWNQLLSEVELSREESRLTDFLRDEAIELGRMARQESTRRELIEEALRDLLEDPSDVNVIAYAQSVIEGEQ